LLIGIEEYTRAHPVEKPSLHSLNDGYPTPSRVEYDHKP
jgi:hypothetical protein